MSDESGAAAAQAPLQARLISTLGGALITGLMRTTRFEVSNARVYEEWLRPRRAAMDVLGHGRLVPCSYHHRQHGLATLISLHRDGDYIAGVVEGWGYQVVRGSSSRGGTSALRRMVRLLRGGTPIAVTPDGPRGPRQEMKLGPLLAAQMAGVPVIPVSAGTDRAWWFEGWDRFMVPKPFSRIRLAYADPVWIPRDADEPALTRIGAELGNTLDRLTAEVDHGG
jgi:lysophospholipid acyltransferase (LPLAT)-like uncharacterized protein